VNSTITISAATAFKVGLFGALGVLVSTACGAPPTPAVVPHAAPTAVYAPTAAPTVQPTAAPAQAVTITGQGSKVTDQYDFTAGNYKVTWSATPSGYFRVHGFNKAGGDGPLISEIAPTTGQTVFQALGGTYYFQIEGSAAPSESVDGKLSWSIRFDPIT
jgi:hypothetical protein